MLPIEFAETSRCELTYVAAGFVVPLAPNAIQIQCCLCCSNCRAVALFVASFEHCDAGCISCLPCLSTVDTQAIVWSWRCKLSWILKWWSWLQFWCMKISWKAINIVCIVQEDEGGNNESEEQAVIGFWSGFAWLVGMTVFIALLSEYVVDTIEVIDSWHLLKFCYNWF